VIRTAVADDLPSLRGLFRRSSLSNQGDRANLLAHPEVLELPDDGVLAGRTRVAVASDGEIVGFATTVVAPGQAGAEAAEPRPAEPRPTEPQPAEPRPAEPHPAGRGILELEDLFVDPPRMRQGVARALVDDVVQAARARGVARIDVTGNEHALPFYLGAGFVRDGVSQTLFGPAPHLHLDLAAGQP
jgi:GNAT superfamily N-acetyltransferase